MKSKSFIYKSALIAALGGFLFGFDTAVISGTTQALEDYFLLDQFWLGFTVASALIGTIVGAFTAAKPADSFGRRYVLFILAVLFLISAIGSAVTTNWYLFLFFRFIGGLGVGGASVVAPMYIAEISPAPIRGRLVAFNQLNVVIGILMAFISNYFVAQYFDFNVAWRWMLGVEAVPALLFFGLLFVIPNSPRWLMLVGKRDEARSVLIKLGYEHPDEMLKQIIESTHTQKDNPFAPLFKKVNMFPIFLAWSIAMFNQLSGINALMYYAPRIFEMAGADVNSALYQSVIIGSVNLLFTLLGLSIIDKVGRRKLIMIGSIGTFLCLGLVAYQFYNDAMGVYVLIGLIGFIAFFAMSQGAVIWVFISEVFPNTLRSKGQSLGSMTHWVMAAVVSWIFPVIADQSGGHAFAFFSAMMLLQFFFALKIMPETKGRTLEELSESLTK